MIVRTNRYSGFGAFGADDPCASKDWEPWCDCRFANDPEMRVKCKTKPWSCCPFGICPPWASPKSSLGQACRGLPKEGSGFLVDAAYTVQTGLSAVSLIDKIAVPMQSKGIVAEEVKVQTEREQLAAQQAAQVRYQEQRKAIGSWVKYGALAAGGLVVVIVAVKALRRRPAAAAPAPAAKPKLKLVRRAA